MYSTHTGEYVRDLDGIPGKKIVAIQCDSIDSRFLYGCTESGDVISWKWKSGVINAKQRIRFNMKSEDSSNNHTEIVNSFALIDMPDQTQRYGLITWRTVNIYERPMHIGIFNLMNGLQESTAWPLPLT